MFEVLGLKERVHILWKLKVVVVSTARCKRNHPRERLEAYFSECFPEKKWSW